MNAGERALDAALARALSAPPIPAGFRAQLDAALIRATAAERGDAARAGLERERRERLAELEAAYLRRWRRTAGAMIAGGVAAGAAVRLLTPWFDATFGSNAVFAIVASGTLAGLAIGTASWMRHLGYQNPIELF